MGVTLAAQSRASLDPAPTAPWDLQMEGAQGWGAAWLCRLRRALTAPAGASVPGPQALAELHLPWARLLGPRIPGAGLQAPACLTSRCTGETAESPGFPT